MLDENDIALVPLNFTKSRSNNLHHSHQHIFQHQSSVSSTTSVQTVFHNTDTNIGENKVSINSNSITAASTNQMILLGTSSSSASFQSANGNAHSINANGSTGECILWDFLDLPISYVHLSSISLISRNVVNNHSSVIKV